MSQQQPTRSRRTRIAAVAAGQHLDPFPRRAEPDDEEEYEPDQPDDDYPLWPAALGVGAIVGAGIVLYLNTPDPALFSAVIVNAAIISVIAVWFGWGIALLVGGVASDSGNQLLGGALVIASSVAVPYMLLLSGIFKLLTSR